MNQPLDYQKAGVDIDVAEGVLESAKNQIRRTHTDRVLGRYGTFSGLFDLKGLGRDPILVVSCDSVGTKLKLAFKTGLHYTIGQDLVNHCVNDIVCCGAHPLFFVDYLGIEKVSAKVFEEIVSGLVESCKKNGLVLLGGETAELPGLYHPGEYDLVGTIVGFVERDSIIDGSRIKAGDAVIGLASSGLHTNGYSLAQKALFEMAALDAGSVLDGFTKPISEDLLTVHRCYGSLIHNIIDAFDMRGIAHITGGGFEGNIPRILPNDVQVVIETKNWEVPSIFTLIQSKGNIDTDEMYRVFNMGIGMVLICPENQTDPLIDYCRSKGCPAYTIGICCSHTNGSKLTLKF